MLVDSHCHLDFEDFDADREAVLTRARAAGVGLMVTISTKITLADKIIALAEAHEDVVCSVGIHPHEAGANPKHRHRKYPAVGASESCRHWRDRP